VTIARHDTETVRKAIALAVRAPSVHNTQPWRWRVGVRSVHLFADWTRQVPATDPDGRDLVISCGAALHHLRIALAAFGWSSAVHRIPDPGTPGHLAAIELLPHEPTEEAIALAATIDRRRTDRRRMSSWPVPVGHLREITDRVRDEGALAIPVTDPVTRFRLSGAIAQAAVIQESAPDYAAELGIWTGRSGVDGVPATSIPPPDLDQDDDIHLRSYPRGVLSQPPGKRYEQQTALVVIATSSDDLLSRLRAGEATSAALLTATQLGLAACPLSQPLEIADTRRAIRDDVLDAAAMPQLLLRLGWAPISAQPLPHTPRRDVDDVLDREPDEDAGQWLT
jgi:nitroreductase